MNVLNILGESYNCMITIAQQLWHGLEEILEVLCMFGNDLYLLMKLASLTGSHAARKKALFRFIWSDDNVIPMPRSQRKLVYHREPANSGQL